MVRLRPHHGSHRDRAGPDGRWAGVTYRCTVTKDMPDGRKVIVATCEGYAGYDEDRFYLTAEDARRKAEEKERANAKSTSGTSTRRSGRRHQRVPGAP